MARFTLVITIGRRCLLGANAGVWNVDNRHRIRYEDMNQDGYVDRWLLTYRPIGRTTEELRQSLQTAGGVMLYGGNGQVKLLRQQVAPMLSRAPSPAPAATVTNGFGW